MQRMCTAGTKSNGDLTSGTLHLNEIVPTDAAPAHELEGLEVGRDSKLAAAEQPPSKKLLTSITRLVSNQSYTPEVRTAAAIQFLSGCNLMGEKELTRYLEKLDDDSKVILLDAAHGISSEALIEMARKVRLGPVQPLAQSAYAYLESLPP